jgi:hypothetical protein
MEQKPLDLEVHEGETKLDVWKRRVLFLLLIVLCVAFAAPTFGSCSGALGSGGSNVWGSFTVAGRRFVVREADFRRAHARYAAFARLYPGAAARLFPEIERKAGFGDDEIWAQLILDEAAKAGGVHVSDAEVQEALESHPQFQTAGHFDRDKYSAEMRQMHRYQGVDHAEFTSALRSILRTERWRSVWASAYSVPQSRETWQEWSKRNVKLTVDYVVQPYAPLAAKVASLPVTDEELKRIKILPKAVELLTLPARRGYEAAFVRTREVTDAQREAMTKLAADAGLLPKDESLQMVAWRQFYSNSKTGPYTRTAWIALHKPEYEAKLAEWQKLPEPRPEGSKPKEPGADWPEKPADEFGTYWRPFVEADVLGAATLRHMAGRAERESKSFADLAADFAQYGVRVVKTAEPLADADLPEKFPEGLGKDSELEGTVRAALRAPEAGTAFVPKVVTEPFLACRINERIRDRGWMIVRCSSYEAPRERDINEVRKELENIFREHRATELAGDLLRNVRTQVEAVQGDVAAKEAALRKLAGEAGLEVRTIRRFNALTERPTPPPAGGDAAAEAAAAQIRQRVRVQDEYPFLSKLDAGKFRDPVILDDRAGGAFLMLVVEKQEPGPLEIDEATLQSERIGRMYMARESMLDHFAPKELKARYGLELTPEGRTATEKQPEPEKKP